MILPLSHRDGQCQLAVRVTPKASANKITGLHSGADRQVSLAVKVTAAPDKGQANKAVIDLLSKELGVPRTSLTLVRGETDRHKVFAYSGEKKSFVDKVSLCLQRAGL